MANWKPAFHHPELYYDVQDPDGEVKRFFETHPQGPRYARRRMKMGHHPHFTKKCHPGRDHWDEKICKDER
jgi:hypothetical protein